MSSDRIMIVEAGSPTSLDLRKKLAALGYSVVAQASQGEDAVQIAGQQRPDLVLMDLHLKGKLDGIQAAGRIKALYNIPVIFLSANMDVVTLEQARAAEPYSYIIKPFEERELESNITVALYKHETERRLRETEAKYQTLFNIMAQGVVYQDAKGQITAANPAAGRILGLSQDELLARSSFDPAWKAIREDGSPLPVEDQPPMLAIRTGREVTGQVLGLFQPQKGEYVWIRANSVPQFENGSSVPGMVVTTFEEITDTKKFEDGLKASEVRYRSLVETSPDGITLNDLQGHFLAANRQALGMLGFSSFEELQASRATSFDFVADPCWLSRPESLLKTLSEDSPRQLEYTFRRRDGSTFPADASLALLRDAADQPQAFLTINRDVSDRKRSEVQLRNLSQAVVQSADSIVITDTEGRIEFVNPQFEQTTGYSLEEVLGKNPRILKSGEQSREFYQDLWETIKSGRIWRGELHNRRKDGSYFWEEASIAPVVDEDGTVSHYIASKRDITERKQLEQVMRIKDSAITSSINAIALADLNGRLTYVNPAFVRLWGYISADEIVGKSVAGIWREDAPVGEVILSLLQGKGWQGELYAKRSDGSYMDVDVSAHLVLDETGKPLCIMSSFVDITARKQAEAAEKEEHRLSEALRLTAEALSSSLKLDEVLEMVLENAGQVIANDSMTIMLLEGENLKVVRHRGYAERGLKDYIENNQFKIEDFPSLRAMIETRQPNIISDVRNAPDWKNRPEVEWVRSYAGVPICRREQVIGFLNLDSSTPNFFTAAHASRLKAFASQAAVAIENARLYEQDHVLSITDSLTGLNNSRYFFELARLEFERSRRYQSNMSVIMIDVDLFKQVNDNFGHLVGDDVLREIARRVRSCLRVVDVAVRYGGEEFAVLMAQTDLYEATQAAERIRLKVGSAPFEATDGHQVSITISLGVASLSHEHNNLNMLIKSADDALYDAKAAGRNRVSVWQKKSK